MPYLKCSPGSMAGSNGMLISSFLSMNFSSFYPLGNNNTDDGDEEILI